MAFWLYTPIVLAAIVVVLALFSRIRIRMRYSRSGEQDQLIVLVRAMFGTVRYRMIVPAIMIRGRDLVYERKSSARVGGKPKLNLPEWKVGTRLLRRWRQWKPMMRRVLRRVECTRFRLEFRVGTGDAPSTAVLSGVLWSAYGCALGAFSAFVKLKSRPYGGVEPVFGRTEFAVVWEADFQMRAGALLAATLSFLWNGEALRKTLKMWRGLRRGPQTKPNGFRAC